MRIVLSILFILSLPCAAIAQTRKVKAPLEEMNVELPDETEEAALLQPGEWQLEAGLLYNKFKSDPDAAIGLVMLRHGVCKWLELRLLAEDGKNRDLYMEKTVQSTYPLALSAKVALLTDQHNLPDITFVTYVKLPFTSRSEEQASYMSPVFLLAFENKLSDDWKLEYNAGIQQEAYSRHWIWLGNASLHYQVLPPLEVFAEYFAQYDNEAPPQHNAGLGAAYQCNNYLEIFLAGGSSVNYSESNHFATWGLAVKMK